jgi:sec-independent protein translocase protein TatA
LELIERMFLFSPQGIMVIVVIALLLFGPEKLPEMARVVGRFMAEFKRAQESVEATLRAEMYTSDKSAGGGAATSAAAVYSAAASAEDDEEEDEE